MPFFKASEVLLYWTPLGPLRMEGRPKKTLHIPLSKYNHVGVKVVIVI